MKQLKIVAFKRVLPIVLSLVIVVSSSIYPKQANANVEALKAATPWIIGLVFAGLVTNRLVSNDFELSGDMINSIIEDAQNAGADVISGITNTYEAIQQGQDLRGVASGVALNWIWTKLKEKLGVSNIAQTLTINMSSGTYTGYFVRSVVSNKYNKTVSLYTIPKPYMDNSFDISKVEIRQYNGLFYYRLDGTYDSNLGTVQACAFAKIYDNTTGTESTFLFRPKIYRHDGQITGIEQTLNAAAEQVCLFNLALGFTDENFPELNVWYQSGMGAISAITNPDILNYGQDTISIPSTLPPTIINNITNWDGVSNMVISPPIDYAPEDVIDVPIDSTGGEVIQPENPSLPEETWWDNVLDGITGISQGIQSGLDRLIDSISNAAQDFFDNVRDWMEQRDLAINLALEGIKAKFGELATSISTTFSPAIEGIQSITSSIAEKLDNFFKPPDKNIDWDKLKNIQFFNKFPFSIPKDFVYLVGLLVADPVAPKIDFEFQVDFLGGDNDTKTLDFARFDDFMVIVRSVELIAFVICMIYFTKNLIWK